MDRLKIDTNAAVVIADEIKGLNKNLKSRFNELQKAMNQLDEEWSGNVATRAIEDFNKMSSEYKVKINAELNGLAHFLNSNVAKGYEMAEDANKRLANYFK